MEKAIEKTREVAKGDDAQAIKSAISELEAASHAVSKTLYEGAQAAGATAEAAAEPPDAESTEAADDDTIDAEFEVKDS